MRSAGSQCESYLGSTEKAHTDLRLWIFTTATGSRPEDAEVGTRRFKDKSQVTQKCLSTKLVTHPELDA